MNEKVQVEIEDQNDQEEPKTSNTIDDSSQEPQPADDDEEAGAGADDDPETRLQAAEKQSQEYYDRLLRLSAEFDNYKKRSQRDMRDMVRFANEKLIVELLTVVDNLERAIESAPQDGDTQDPLVAGIDLTLNEVRKILERNHVQPVNALGESFDPNFHQAMMQEESADHSPNTVIREMQKGYTLHERLIRPAMVVVSKAKEDS